jgi:hypothetical protein
VFSHHDDLYPVVTTHANFDEVRGPGSQWLLAAGCQHAFGVCPAQLFVGMRPCNLAAEAPCALQVLVPADHVSRSPNDTYYVTDSTVLRCHTSAHQAEMLRQKHPAFLVTGEQGVSQGGSGRPG